MTDDRPCSSMQPDLSAAENTVEASRSTSDPNETISIPKLSLQQWRVFSLLGQAMTNKEIARTLNISDSTVKCHVTQLFRILGCRNRTQLALLSLRTAYFGAAASLRSADPD